MNDLGMIIFLDKLGWFVIEFFSNCIILLVGFLIIWLVINNFILFGLSNKLRKFMFFLYKDCLGVLLRFVD